MLRPADAIGRIGGDEFAVLLADIEPADALEIAARMAAALAGRAALLDRAGELPDGRHRPRGADAGGRRPPLRLAPRAARRGGTSVDERLSWAATLAHAVDMRMNAEHEHSRAVADCAVAIAAALGWQEEMLGMLRIAAMLHDVGKVTVPDRILASPDR